MKYLSTRDSALRYASAEAVKMGLSRDGGLLTPTEIPQIDQAFLEGLVGPCHSSRQWVVSSRVRTGATAAVSNLSGP